MYIFQLIGFGDSGFFALLVVPAPNLYAFQDPSPSLRPEQGHMTHKGQ